MIVDVHKTELRSVSFKYNYFQNSFFHVWETTLPKAQNSKFQTNISISTKLENRPSKQCKTLIDP